jgi:hypothetical protein
MNTQMTKPEQQVRNLVAALGLHLFEDEITTTVEYFVDGECFQFVVETVDYETELPLRGKRMTDTWRDLLERIQSTFINQ